MKIIETFTPELISQVYHLYQIEWWTKGRTLAETRSVIEGSQICLAAIDENGSLQAFARIITDFTFKALIFDVIVSESSRGSGLGQLLMQNIKQHPKLKLVKHFELYCLPELEAFYQQHGYSNEVNGVQLMRLKNN